MAYLLESHNFKYWFLTYVPSTQEIVSSHDLVFDETFSSALAHTSHLYSESLDMRPEVLYTTYDTSYHKETDYIITFIHF